VALKNEDTIVNFGCVVERLVVIAGFGAPDFGGTSMTNDEAVERAEKMGGGGVARWLARSKMGSGGRGVVEGVWGQNSQ
jgi:hypothetical protein